MHTTASIKLLKEKPLTHTEFHAMHSTVVYMSQYLGVCARMQDYLEMHLEHKAKPTVGDGAKGGL